MIAVPSEIQQAVRDSASGLVWLRDPQTQQEYVVLSADRFAQVAIPGGASPVVAFLESQLESLSLPRSWSDEGVEAATPDCCRHALQVFGRLFDEYRLIPYKVTLSKEGGVFAAYRSLHNKKHILRVEIDNELDVVAVVSDGTTILDSGLLDGADSERSLLQSFDSRLA